VQLALRLSQLFHRKPRRKTTVRQSKGRQAGA
jgi:hypothetical protein